MTTAAAAVAVPWVPLGIELAHRSAALLGKGYSAEVTQMAADVKDQVCAHVRNATTSQLRARSVTFELPKHVYSTEFRHALDDLLCSERVFCRWVDCCESAPLAECPCATTPSIMISW